MSAHVNALSASNRFSLVFRHELRVLSADRTLWWTCGFLLLLIAYSLYTGLTDVRIRDQALADIVEREAKTQQRNIEGIRQVMAGTPPADPFSNPVDPALIAGGMGARYAIMPSAALAPLAIGQADMFPTSYRVTHRSKVTFMYDSEMENPWNLLAGHLDLAFVITYLLPLLILAVSYNLLSVEREQGTLRMLLSQPLGLATLMLGKVSARAVCLLGIAALVPAIMLTLARPEVRDPEQLALLFAWMGLVIAYGLFWFAIATGVNALGKGSATNALILVSTWVALVLIVPVVLNMLVQRASPAPSRTELATTTRIITIQGLERYNELLSTDYRYASEPEVLLPKDGKIQVSARMKGQYLIHKDVDAEIEKVLDQFDQQLARQQTLVDRLGVISPAIVVHEGMAALAGTGSKRFANFQQQVKEFHAKWKDYFDPRIRDGIAVQEADFQAMPRFAWREFVGDGTVGATLSRVVVLMLPIVIVLVLAGRALRRMEVT